MRGFLLLLMGVLLSQSVVAQEHEISWYSYDHAPAAFLRGEHKGEGFVELTRKLITKQLPQYQHVIKEANFGRIMFDMKRGKPGCFPAMIKTAEREQFVTFSKPSILQYNVQVLIKKSLAEELKLGEDVDLKALFEQHDLTLAKIISRSYTEQIDTLLSAYPQNIVDRSTNSIYQLFQSLVRDRVDFLLVYPSVSHYNLKQLGHLDDYVSLPIKGTKRFLTSHVGCTKGKWGSTVIADIDQALTKAKQSDAYFHALTSWLNPEHITPDFRRWYQQRLVEQ
ncbi:TIGR02285 family protein [Thalassotalea euphylliae]|uniref:TIGR02285 family protein n=1 Tax=Thalassotalea euphylliae TaxID=1655234 RepID=UPI00363282A9